MGNKTTGVCATQVGVRLLLHDGLEPLAVALRHHGT